VGTGLVAAPDDLVGHAGVAADGVADHKRGHRDLVGVEQVQDAGTPSRAPYS
jgi:hypothetical protein